MNNNTTSNVTINNFGSEDRSYVSNDTIKHCLDNAVLVPLLMDVFFNSAHPENHTIRHKNDKLSRVVVHTDGKWVECDMNASIDQMMKTEHNALIKYYWSPDFYGNVDIDEKAKMAALENIGKLYATKLTYFEQRRCVHSILKNAKKEYIT